MANRPADAAGASRIATMLTEASAPKLANSSACCKQQKGKSSWHGMHQWPYLQGERIAQTQTGM
jgi:hypothetical protein